MTKLKYTVSRTNRGKFRTSRHVVVVHATSDRDAMTKVFALNDEGVDYEVEILKVEEVL